MREALSAYLADGEAREPYYSLRLGGSTGSTRPVRQLFQGTCQAVRSRGTTRVITALISGLSDLADDGLARRPRVSAVGLVRGGYALLLPARLRGLLPALEPRLETIGVQVVDSLQIGLEPATGAVIVTEPSLDIRFEPLEELLGDADEDRWRPVAEPGRYAIAAWGLASPTTRAEAVTRAMRLVTNLDRLSPQSALGTVTAGLRASQLLDLSSVSSVSDVQELADATLPGHPGSVASSRSDQAGGLQNW